MGATTFTKGLGSFGTFGELVQSLDDVIDNKRVVRGILTLSASYATGGDTLSLAQVGLRRVDHLLVDAGGFNVLGATEGIGLNTSGLSIALGGTLMVPLILAYDTNNTEVAAATNLSARQPIPVWLFGVD